MCYIPTKLSKLDEVDKTLKNIKTLENLAATEWRKFKPRLDLADDQHVALLCNNLRLLLMNRREDLLLRRELLVRISELEHDLNICKRHLTKLIHAALCPNDIDASGNYLGKLENVNAELANLRRTIPVSLIRSWRASFLMHSNFDFICRTFICRIKMILLHEHDSPIYFNLRLLKNIYFHI